MVGEIAIFDLSALDRSTGKPSTKYFNENIVAACGTDPHLLNIPN